MNDGTYAGEERRSEVRRALDRELQQMSKEALDRAMRAESNLTTHEALCALRYQGIADAQERGEKRLDAIIRIGLGILLSVTGTAVLLLITLVLNGVKP